MVETQEKARDEAMGERWEEGKRRAKVTSSFGVPNKSKFLSFDQCQNFH
jgi:hypothetical protein